MFLCSEVLVEVVVCRLRMRGDDDDGKCQIKLCVELQSGLIEEVVW